VRRKLTAKEQAALFREIRNGGLAGKREDAHLYGKEAYQKILGGTSEAVVTEKRKDKKHRKMRWMMTVEDRLEKIEAMLLVLVERQKVKDFYEVEEFAKLVGKSCFTCREWCRLGRIRAEKKLSGRGAYARWVVPHAELLRWQREGLLPLQRLA
jgi:hypothetical protein